MSCPLDKKFYGARCLQIMPRVIVGSNEFIYAVLLQNIFNVSKLCEVKFQNILILKPNCK